MAYSQTNSHSEPAKIEQIITEFFPKSLQIILESRSSCISSRNFSGDQTVLSSPSSSSSSSSVRPRDKWFNLALRECPAALENLDLWRQNNLLVVDVILVRRSIDSKGNSDNLSFNPILYYDEFLSESKSEKVIERWIIQYESCKGLNLGSSKKTGSSSSHSMESLYKKTYRKSIILLRSLYVMVRLLPAFKLFQDLNSSGQIRTISLAYKVSSYVEHFSRREEAEMTQFSFVPIDTCCGKLCLSVMYRATLSDVSSEEPSTPLSPQFIPDYVGSPTTDPLRRFPSLPSAGLMPHGSPSYVPFARRHSWSNDLHRAAPSMSPSPSPTYSDTRGLPSKMCSSRLPPRCHLNMDNSPPVSLPHHPSISLTHKKNTSFDEYWSSPPFSPSPSPSPPTHLRGSHLSKGLLRSESAPVSIPFSRPGRSPGLPSQVLPPSPSPKCVRPSCSSHADNARAQISLGSSSQSSPPESKLRMKQNPLRSGEFQTGSGAHKAFSFAKDEVGNFCGAKISSSSSPRISFSRSSSRFSLQEELDESEFCPFAVDDDDITDPRNRAESFDGKGHISQAMELGSLLPSRKSQDAAVGALVQMLKTAPPLCQDSSCSFNFSQAHNKAESSSNRIQPNKSSESESPAFQNSALDPGIASSGRSMLKTTADALEELRGFKEMKDMLLRQGGSQLPDCPDTARTVGRGSTVR